MHACMRARANTHTYSTQTRAQTLTHKSATARLQRYFDRDTPEKPVIQFRRFERRGTEGRRAELTRKTVAHGQPSLIR